MRRANKAALPATGGLFGRPRDARRYWNVVLLVAGAAALAAFAWFLATMPRAR
jgi:hypothetical protein